MNEIETKMKPFARRVRWMAAWKGLALGATAGGALALGWAILDWSRVLYADWKGLAIVAGVGSLGGAIASFFVRIRTEDLASSIDRRAGLKDRVTTAVEPRGSESGFDEAQVKDADKALDGLSPSGLYPVKFGRWQAIGLATLVLAASVFLLGNSPMVRGPKTAEERKELKEIGQKVERIARPLTKTVEGVEVPANQKKLASELNKFSKELEEGKLNKEEAMRKVNDLAQKAEDEVKSQAEESEKKAVEAETALGKYEKLKLEEAGLSQDDLAKMNLSPREQAALDRMMDDNKFESPKSKFSDRELEQMGASRSAEKLAQLTPEQRKELQDQVAKQQAELQKQIDKIDQMSDQERKQFEQQRDALMKQQQQMQKLAEALKLSEEAKKAMQELMQSEEMQKLRKALQEMQAKSQQTQQGQPPTKEEIEQLRQQIEELAKAMKDPEMKKLVEQQLKDALKQLESGQMSAETMQLMMEAMGMSGQQGGEGDGDPSTGKDDQFADTGKVMKSEKEMKTTGKTTPTRVSGQWDDKKGEQWSVTVRAPTQVGNRSSVPYQTVMPKFKSAAEKAISSGKIPKEKEKRVKEYFDSLVGGKK